MPNILTLFSGAERGGGSPAEVYQFQRGGDVWRYTTARTTQTVDGVTYAPASIRRGAIEQKQDAPGSRVTITVGLELAVAQALLTDTGEPMACSIRRVQTAGTPAVLVIRGSVKAVKFTGDAVEFTVGTVEDAFTQLVPRVRVQPTCPWAIYSPACGVDKTAFALDTTITSVSGQVITVDAVPDASMVSGLLRLPSGRVLFVAAQSTTQLTFWCAIPSEAAADAAVTLYPGCDKTFTTCETVFDNAKHFGGFPNLPMRNVTTTTMN